MYPGCTLVLPGAGHGGRFGAGQGVCWEGFNLHVDVLPLVMGVQKVKGTVKNIANFGCFVDLGDGVEGLLRLSEMVDEGGQCTGPS